MQKPSPKGGPYQRADERAKASRLQVDTPQTRSPFYRLAFQDDDFMFRDKLHPVRLQLELLKARIDLAGTEYRIHDRHLWKLQGKRPGVG